MKKITKGELRKIVNEELKSLDHGFFDKMFNLKSDDAGGMIKAVDAAIQNAPDPYTKPRSREEADALDDAAKSLKDLVRQSREAGLAAVPNKKQRAHAQRRLDMAQSLADELNQASDNWYDDHIATSKAEQAAKYEPAPERKGRYDDMSAKDVGFATDMDRGDYTRTYRGAGTGIRKTPRYVGYEKEFDPFREGKMKITKSGLQKIINEEIENFLSENK